MVGSDFFMNEDGTPFRCDESRIAGEPGNTYEDYWKVTGNDCEDIAKRMAFFSKLQVRRASV